MNIVIPSKLRELPELDARYRNVAYSYDGRPSGTPTVEDVRSSTDGTAVWLIAIGDDRFALLEDDWQQMRAWLAQEPIACHLSELDTELGRTAERKWIFATRGEVLRRVNQYFGSRGFRQFYELATQGR